MIVRIMGQGQYRLDSSLVDRINAIDNKIVYHVARGDQTEFRKDLIRLISEVKEQGKPVGDAEIVESAIIVPPEDLTFEEAQRIFSGHGLIKD
jgi:hypothetical protein